MSESSPQNRAYPRNRRSKPAWNKKLVNLLRKEQKYTPRHELAAIPCPPKPVRRRMLDEDHRRRPQIRRRTRHRGGRGVEKGDGGEVEGVRGKGRGGLR